MGRESRTIRHDLRPGDTIEILEDSICLPAGFYKVEAVTPPLLHLRVGEFYCGISFEILGRYRKLLPNEACSIDWSSEMAKLKRFHEQLELDRNWEDIKVAGLNDEPGSPFETSVRRPRIH